MRISELSARQLADITIIERVASILSLLGCCWIALTFLCNEAFRKPINRLVFYASIGNIFTNAATIMSRDFVHNPLGVGCQVQAFLIQMFMPADAIWTLFMATNVWLTFYHKFDYKQLRALEKWYFVLSYGVPLIPALVFAFVSGEVKGRIYGNATLWCWIASDWEVLRIACFYGPVWLVILATITIYLRAGRDIYTKRKQLLDLQDQTLESLPTIIDPFTNCGTTGIMVTSETVTTADIVDVKNPSSAVAKPGESHSSNADGHRGYHVTVSSQTPDVPSEEPVWPELQQVQSPTQNQNRISRHTTGARTRDFVHSMSPQVPTSQNAAMHSRRRAAMESNNAALSYTKVAMLFFFAMMITWIPSSANRLYSVIRPGHISLPLQMASAFVLPLQGLWNALIYTTTSLSACRELWSDIIDRKSRRSSRDGGLRSKASTWAFGHDSGERRLWSMRSSSQKLSLEESESMTELQDTRRKHRDG